MRNLSLALLLLISVYSLKAQEQVLHRGAVTETVTVNDSISIPYSIYLPPTYDVNNPSNALFIFDSEGEGTKATRLFVSALQGENYIIVANNKPLPQVLDSLDANAKMGLHIMQDVFKKVSLDMNNVYLAGHKSGAQVASALSYIVRGKANLLLIDDVYFANRFADQAQENLAIGVVGEASPNYYQMEDYFYMMKAYNNDNTLYFIEETKTWPSAALMGTLINRLYHLNNERLNKKLSDTVWQRQYQTDLNTIKQLTLAEEYVNAYELATDLKGEYRGNVDLDPLRDLQRGLRRSDAYKQEKRYMRSDDIEEGLLLDDISYFLDEDLALGSFSNLGYWDERIQQFRAAAQNSAKPNEQKVAKRMLGYIDYVVTDFLTLNRVALFDQRIFANVLRTLLDPENDTAYLDIISLAATDGDDNTAYFYLEELLKQGYDDYEALYSIPKTELLRIKPTYNELVESYLGKSKF